MGDLDRINGEQRFWNKFARRYDTFMDRRVKSYGTLLEKLLQEIGNGTTVLEVATGTGVVSLRMAEKAGRVYALDLSPAMVMEAKKKARAQNLENIEFLVDDAYELPFEHGTFDAVICSNALHNMKDPATPLMEMRRVLKPGGRVFTPTFCHGEGLKSRIISWIMSLTGFPAYHRFTIEELTTLIEQSGFTIARKEIIKDAIPMAYVVGAKA
jgi:phosphatidylethanolamine/phosphatidyl-N-methylethanolamine N-methyltransferase